MAKRPPTDKSEDLRRGAERRLRFESVPLQRVSKADVGGLVHELRVHQIELETQNEHLRQTQVELEQSRSKYASLFDFAPVGYFIFDERGCVSTLNLTGAAMLRKDRRDLIGKPFNLFVDPRDRDLLREHRQTVFQTGRAQPCEIRLLPVGEAPMVVRLNSVPVTDPADETRVLACRTAMSDITETKQTEEALRRREEALRVIVEGANVGTWDRDLLTGRTTWNERLYALLGRDPARSPVGSETFFEYIHADDRPRVREHLEQTQADGTDFFDEFRIVREDGQIRWLGAAGRIYRDEAGRAIRMSGVKYDITSRKEAELALREAHDELEVRVQERTAELQQSNERLKEEIEERIQTEQSLKLEQARLDALLRLSRLGDVPPGEIFGFILEQAISLTQSKIGFVGLLDEDESVYTLHAVSREVVKECQVAGSPMQWHVLDAGIWAEAVRERRTLFVNDYTQPHVGKKGLPPGHPPVERFMVVPILDSGKIVALAGVGNKALDYGPSDERQVALLLSGMWAHVQRNRARQQLQNAHDELEKRVEERTAELAATVEALRQSQKDLDRAQEVGQIGWWRLDVDRDVLTWSDENHRIFGVPKGPPLTYETFLSIVHPDDHQYVDASWQAALDGAPYELEHRIIVDGAVKWVREKAYLEFDHAGKLQGGFGITQDITERKRTQEQMANLAKFPSEDPFPVLRFDQDGKIRYANVAGSMLLVEWGRNVGERAPDHWCELIGAALRSSRPSMEQAQVHDRVFSLALVPIPDRGYVNVYGADITERLRAEQSLQEAHDRLEERVRERTGELEQTVGVLQEEVGKRVRTQTQLARRNEILQKIIDNIPVMLCFYDGDGDVGLINEEFHRVLGYAREDFEDGNFMALCYPDGASRRQAWKYMTAAKPGWHDFFVQSKTGGKTASSWASVRLSDGSYIGIGIDVRQRLRYENRIKDSEERYRTLVELSPDGIGVERDGKIRFVNATACSLLRAKRADDLQGRPILDFVHPDQREQVETQLARLRRRRESLPLVETRLLRLDGTTVDVELSAMPIVFESKPAIQIVMRDVTRRKEAERASVEARQFAESVIETIQEALVALDADLKVRSANRTFYETFAVTPEETEGRPIYEIGNGQWDIPELRQLLEDILPHNSSFEDFEVEHDFERIGPRIMRLNARRIYRETQETAMILLAIQDVTIRKQQEREILANQRELAKLTEELLLTEERERRRIATALHDSVGQSLAFSKRELGVLRKDLPEALLERLDRAKNQIDEAIGQTRSLTSELSPATLYTFGLEAAVEELAEKLAQREGFECDLEIQESDEPLAEETSVFLYRATRELLLNVAKHAMARHVSVRISRDGRTVRIEVEDDGKGFDLSALDPVRGERTSFGLFSVREQLAHMGGSFEIRSTPGGGARATLQLPLRKTNEQPFEE